MKRSSFDESRDQRIANETMDGQAPCMFCKAMTELETLSNYGARCWNCYFRFVTGGKPVVPMTHEEKRAALESMRRIGEPNAGARPADVTVRRLRELEAGGMRLTFGQRHVLECCERAIGVASEWVQGAAPAETATAGVASPSLAELEAADHARKALQHGRMDLDDINAALQEEASL